MREKEVAKEDGKAFGVQGIKVETQFLHPGYDPPVETQREITKTGLLLILEIRPTENPTLPVFRGRWDENGGAPGGASKVRYVGIRCAR